MTPIVRAALVLALALPACVDAADGRTRIAFDVVIGGAEQAPLLPVADAGAVRLDVARLHLGALTFFEGGALLARPGGLDGLLSFAAARAHPGHGGPGEVLAATAEVGVVDLLAPESVTLSADGLSGPYGSLTLPLVGGATLVVEGSFVADGAGDERPFRAVLGLPYEVEGIPCVVDEMQGRRVRLEVRVPELVRRIDPGLLPAGSDAPIDLAALSQARNALTRALEAQTTFRVTTEDAP
jgi:hypothetical protein